MKLLKFLLLLAVAALGAAFAYINPVLVHVSFYFGEIGLPLGILIFLLIGMGMLAGVLASMSGFIRLKRENAHLRRLSELANQEINNLRTIPLRDR
jgi:putative membrane protein